jgi:hypothetical protein
VTRELPQASRLRPRRHDRIRDEQVREAGVGEDLGLADRGDRQTDRAGVDLATSDGDALVRLRVRPKGDASPAHEPRHRSDPLVHPVEIDDDRRRVERGYGIVIHQSLRHRWSPPSCAAS